MLKKPYLPPMNADERGQESANPLFSICVHPRLSAANLVFDFFSSLLDSTTQDKLATAVVSTAKKAAEMEGVGFRVEETTVGINYSKARSRSQRLNQPVVQTALAIANFYRKPGAPEIALADVGSTDANIAISMGIPAVAVGAVLEHLPHRLEEFAEASSIVPGIKLLLALAVSLTTH
jgi:tripeptide aminopeptidase